MPYLAPETLPATFVCRRLRIPNDLQFLMAVNGALVELTRVWNWEQTGDVTPEQASEVANLMLRDFWLSECPDETPEPGEKLVFGPDASLITYAPQDPYTAASIVPAGYVFPPLYVIEPETLPFPGVQTGDVLTDLSKLPTAWPPLLPPGGYPRFRVNFHVTGPGPGEVELHLVKIPTAGLALVTLDGDPATADFIDLSTADLLDLTDLGALLGTALDGDLVRTHIQELHVAEVGDHFIDVTFLPKIGTSSLIGFGGGLRQVVLGGTAGAGEMPAPQFRLTGTMLEWRPHEAHVWLELGDLGGSTGIEETEVIPVTWEDTPSLVYDPEDKKLTLTLPVGYPPVNDIQATQLTIQPDPGAPSLLSYDEPNKRLDLTLGKYFSQLVRTGGTQFSAWGDEGFNARQSIELTDYLPPMGWGVSSDGYLTINSPNGTYQLAPLWSLFEYLTTEIYGTGAHAKLNFKFKGHSVWTVDLPWHFNFTQSQPPAPTDFAYPNTLQLTKNADGGYVRLTYPLNMIARIRQFSEVPGRIQYQQVNDTNWYSLVDVPPFPGQTTPEPVPGAVDEADAVCLAAMNAARSIGATYEELAARVAVNLFDNPIGFARWMLETAVGVLSRGVPPTLLDDVTLTLSFLFMQGDITALPWSPSLEDKLRCILIDNATITTDLEAGFDYEQVKADVSSLVSVDLQWNFVTFILQWMTEDMLNTAGKVAYFTTPACGTC